MKNAMLEERTTEETRKSSWARKQNLESKTSPFYTLEKQQGARSIMIVIEFANGDLLSLPYTSLMKVEYNLSEGIKLEWGGELLKITGYNLKALFTGITEHRVKTIYENPERQTEDPEELTISKTERM